VLVHDEKNRALASLLGGLQPPNFPEVLGVLYCDPAPTYDTVVHDQVHAAQAATKPDLGAVMRSGRTWTVAG
jgi:2-oxoglutarate ferredoxin oxidoreductase subunit beta